MCMSFLFSSPSAYTRVVMDKDLSLVDFSVVCACVAMAMGVAVCFEIQHILF